MAAIASHRGSLTAEHSMGRVRSTVSGTQEELSSRELLLFMILVVVVRLTFPRLQKTLTHSLSRKLQRIRRKYPMSLERKLVVVRQKVTLSGSDQLGRLFRLQSKVGVCGRSNSIGYPQRRVSRSPKVRTRAERLPRNLNWATRKSQESPPSLPPNPSPLVFQCVHPIFFYGLVSDMLTLSPLCMRASQLGVMLPGPGE